VIDRERVQLVGASIVTSVLGSFTMSGYEAVLSL
jgi:hypothetical protein